MLAAFFVSSFGMIASPQISRMYFDSKHTELIRFCRRITLIVWGCSLPLLFVLFVWREPLITLAFGESFRVSAVPLAGLLIGQLVATFCCLTDPYLTMTGGQKKLSIIILLSAVLNLVLVLLFTPILGLLGPALALSISISFWKLSALSAIWLKDGFWLGLTK